MKSNRPQYVTLMKSNRLVHFGQTFHIYKLFYILNIFFLKLDNFLYLA